VAADQELEQLVLAGAHALDHGRVGEHVAHPAILGAHEGMGHGMWEAPPAPEVTGRIGIPSVL
jgi:hypothetical protein